MLKPVDQNMIELKRVNIKRNDRYPAGTKTIVFDLDETLIHCNENNQIKADVYIPIIFPTGDTI
jgi:CTD small phosphatase-like protein 2